MAIIALFLLLIEMFLRCPALLTEYVCVKSVVPFCLLKPNFPLLSIVAELITTLLLSSFLFQQRRIKAADTGNTSATAVFIKL